jgi:hypothetical protein
MEDGGLNAIADRAAEVKRRYARGGDPPLGSHLLLLLIYNLAAGVFLLRRARSRGLPERIEAGDLLLAGVATHRLSRLITKEKVTAPLRAPFTEFQAKGGPAEVEERPRGRGLRRAVGELLVCPFCMAQWVATALLAGLLAAPRATRLVCSIFSVVAIGDFLHLAYRFIEDRTATSGAAKRS